MSGALSTSWEFETDFEVDQPMNTTNTSPGGSVTRVTGEQQSNGAWSAKMVTPVTSGLRAGMYRVMQFSRKIHVTQFRVYLADASPQVSLEVPIEGWGEGIECLSSLRWVRIDGSSTLTIQRWSEFNDWRAIPGGAGFNLTPQAWHTVRLESDYRKLEYRRLVIDSTEFDLRGLPFRVNPWSGASNRHGVILLWNHTAAAFTAYIDEIKFGELLVSDMVDEEDL